MTDRSLIDKRLAHIVEAVESLRLLARPESVESDPVQRGFVEHTLQTAIQAMIDVAAALVSELRLGEPRTHTELFDRLATAGWLPESQARTCRKIVAFRNVVVHRYLDVDPAIVRAILESHLGDLTEFVRTIRSRLGP